MPRLFVAVGLPPAAAAELADARPPAPAGVRVVEPGQMHLTLHYLGEADLGRTTAALAAVAAPGFTLSVEDIGRFHSANRSVTLWAGVGENPGLRTLHAAIAAVLAPEGFKPEARPYVPHITLARCGPEVPLEVIDRYLAGHGGVSIPDVPVGEFGLYSSAFVGDAPVYHRERAFPLVAIRGAER